MIIVIEHTRLKLFLRIAQLCCLTTTTTASSTRSLVEHTYRRVNFSQIISCFHDPVTYFSQWNRP